MLEGGNKGSELAQRAFETNEQIVVDETNPLYAELLALAVSVTIGNKLTLIKHGEIQGKGRPLIAEFSTHDSVHGYDITTGTVDLGYLTRKGWNFPEMAQACGNCPAMKLSGYTRGLISTVIYGR